MNFRNSLLLSLILLSVTVFSQEKELTNSFVSGSMNVTQVPSIAQQIKDGSFIGIDKNTPMKGGKPKHSGANKTVPGKGFPKGNDPLISKQNTAYKIKGKAPSLVFDAATATYIPSDPTGAVGPNHYLGSWNAAFRIFDKSGVPLMAEASLATIFPGNTDGDPIALYDADADRFIITEFFGYNSGPPYGFNIAISQGPDPVSSGWYVYSFNTSQLPDYPKFSIWSDGYYITTNIGSTNKVFALERDKMLMGTTATFVGFQPTGLVTGGFYSPQVFNVGNASMPANGNATLVYLQDDAWSGITTDHLKLWTINVDWNTPTNSTISSPTQIATSPFISVFDGGSYVNLSQPAGPDIDALQATIMNQAQFRKFATHNSAIFNFVVDTDGSSNELAGIRWYELRQIADGQPWTLYQEGTYISPINGKHAFNASMAMDNEGNIGMGYSTVSTSENIAINYTGRYASDPLGTMSVYETLLAQGSSYNSYSRYADYSHLTIDPTDDQTFWHISEYFNPQRKDVVGVFKLASTFNNDIGVIQINTPVDGILANEYIGITIKNFGNNPQTNFQLSYQVNGGTIFTENFVSTLASGATSPFVFSLPADMSIPGNTYSITCSTNLSGDQDTTNDAVSKDVTHLYPDDIGVIDITAPVSGNTLCLENITATIKNFGAFPQPNLDILYVLDGGAPIMENFNQTLNPGNTTSVTFAVPGDFCAFGIHNLHVSTNLPIDNNPSNDFMDVTISNIPCSSNTDNTPYVIPNAGIITPSINIPFNEVITDVNVNIELYHSRDADIDVFLVGPNGLSVELTTDNGGTGHDYVNTYFDDGATTPITIGSAPFTGSYQPEGSLSDFNGHNTLGNWTLHVEDDTANAYGGTLVSWDLDICFDPNIGIYDNSIDSSDLIIATFDNNQFNISLDSSVFKEPLVLTVYNIMGQKLVSNRVKNIDGVYSYNLDMSFTPTGIYLIKLGDNATFGKVRRIIVR